MKWPFGRKQESKVEEESAEQAAEAAQPQPQEAPVAEPVTEQQLYVERPYNLYWMSWIDPFRDQTDEEIQAAVNAEIRKIQRVLRTNPIDKVKVKSEKKLEKLNAVNGDFEAIARERDMAILMFNEDMKMTDGEISRDPEKIKAAISRVGWRNGTELLSVEGMPQCANCGYINRRTSNCVKCGGKL